MNIFPAIDLYDKKAVRLYKGDYQQMTVYSERPLEVAYAFRAAGASYIHMVDLQGAKTGTTPNYDIVAAVAAQSGLRGQVGGGIRSEAVVEKYLSAGVERVILGTAALNDQPFLCDMVAKYGHHIAVGVDCRDGFVAIKGWTETSSVSCDAFCAQLQQIGVRTIICTDISKDGAMKGTNRELYRELSAKYTLDIIASGGVSTLDDIQALHALGLYGAIIGKAWYTGAIDLTKAIELSR